MIKKFKHWCEVRLKVNIKKRVLESNFTVLLKLRKNDFSSLKTVTGIMVKERDFIDFW